MSPFVGVGQLGLGKGDGLAGANALQAAECYRVAGAGGAGDLARLLTEQGEQAADAGAVAT